MRRNVRFVLCAIALLGAAMPAFAAGVSVPMDEVRVVAFNQPVSTVFMGNPVIADVTMIDAEHAFIMGKTFGETNMIALGVNGRQIANDHITVFGRRVGAVTLNRGAQTYNYTCTALHCETRPVPGDPKTYFDETHTAADTYQQMSIKGASASAPQH